MVACTLLWYSSFKESIGGINRDYQKREVVHAMFVTELTATQILGAIILLLLLGWLIFCCIIMASVSRARRAEARKTAPVAELPVAAVSMAMARPEE
jgi:hypothetical protein